MRMSKTSTLTMALLASALAAPLANAQPGVPQPCPITQAMIDQCIDYNDLAEDVSNWANSRYTAFAEFDIQYGVTLPENQGDLEVEYFGEIDDAMDLWRYYARLQFNSLMSTWAPTCQGEAFFIGQAVPEDRNDEQWALGCANAQLVFSVSQVAKISFKFFGMPGYPSTLEQVLKDAPSDSVSTVYMDHPDPIIIAEYSWFGGMQWRTQENDWGTQNGWFVGTIDKPMWIINNDPSAGPVDIGSVMGGGGG